MSQQFRTNSNKQHYPLHPAKGINEKDFREGDKNILGTPKRQFSSATPNSELAHAKTQFNFIKSLNRRLEESRAGGKARSTEKKNEKAKRNAEADKNLELANKFMERQEKLRRGENPPPVDVVVNVDSGPTLPRNIKPEEQKKIDELRAKEAKKEEKIIKNITEPVTVQPSSPAMARPSNGLGNGHAAPSGQTEEDYAYAVSPAFTTAGKQPQKPQKKQQLSLSQIALMRYPARG